MGITVFTNSVFLSLHFATNATLRKPCLYRFYRIPIGCAIASSLGYCMNKAFNGKLRDNLRKRAYIKKQNYLKKLDTKDGNLIKNSEKDLVNINDILNPIK